MSHPYWNPELPIQERVSDLLGRMTLEEKAAQLVGLVSPEDENGAFSLEKAREHLAHGVAYLNTYHHSRGARETVEYLNAAQKFLREETRLGIPTLGIGEGLHGYMANEATSFPQAIGLASAWDPNLHERVFSVVAHEMRLRGAQYVLSPVLDLARDPRWGRTEETYGEDPCLASRLGVAAVRGLQGQEPFPDEAHVLATAKHFAAHGQPEAGTNAGPANYAERVLREQFLLPFQAVVQEAGIHSVMASYNEINGVPSHINPWLLKQVLRSEWGFQGFVISDGWGVDDLYRLHCVAVDAADAAQQAFSSGVDIELGFCFLHLVEHVRAGRVSLEALEAAVAHMLAIKFRLGLFENPYTDPEAAARLTNTPESQALALEAARKTIILLKNENNLLPLDANKLRSIAVIGPNAAELRLGGYSGDPGNGITILEGLRSKADGRFEVTYAAGCQITQSRSGPRMWWEDEVLAPNPAEDEELITAAVAAARQAQVALLVLGDNEQTCREGWAEQHLGDRDSLDLPGRQEELLRRVVETGVPVVLLLLHGRPASINYAAEYVPAILDGWYLGQAGGTAFTEVLFGEVNPGGKLPITIPRNVGQIPAYYYHKPSARRGYLFSSKKPLFPFGYGLSYTTFAYANLHVSPAHMRPDESAQVSVYVTNTGQRPGDEVVQLYLHDQVSSLTRPVKELKDFQRIHLQPGQTRTVQFKVTPDQLAFLDAQMQRTVEPGLFDVMVGGSSEQYQTVTLEITIDSQVKRSRFNV